MTSPQPISQADREADIVPTERDIAAWEKLGPAIFHGDMTGPEALARHASTAREEALGEVSRALDSLRPQNPEDDWSQYACHKDRIIRMAQNAIRSLGRDGGRG